MASETCLNEDHISQYMASETCLHEDHISQYMASETCLNEMKKLVNVYA